MKLMIYPASKEAGPFARYCDQMVSYDEVSFVVPMGWGNDGDDFMTLDGGESTGITISTDFESELENTDAVLFAKSPIPIPENFLLKKVSQVIELGKEVICESLPSGWNGIKQYKLLRSEQMAPYVQSGRDYPEVCLLPVPVIFVMGIGANTNKFEVQLALRRVFQQTGYHVSQVGTKPISSLFGFEAIPDTIFRGPGSIRDKIICLNRYFYRKYLDEKPDVMIIGIPGGILQTNPFCFEELGEWAYLISQAVSPDATILCTYAHMYSQEYFDEIKALCRYKLNADVKHIVVSNTEMTTSPESRESEYATVSQKIIEENYLKQKFAGVELYSALSTPDMSRLGTSVIEYLYNNI